MNKKICLNQITLAVLTSLLTYPALAEDKSKGDFFDTEAKSLVIELKRSLLQNLSREISKNGTESAIPFCHTNVKSIAKDAAKEKIKKYEFGRTSHKIRNEKNSPEAWLLPYLEKFQGSFFDQTKVNEYPIIGQLPNGKRFYAEPLFVNAQCLQCHGENLAKNVQEKIQVFYPKDKAIGFKLNEFRGLIWVKEK